MPQLLSMETTADESHPTCKKTVARMSYPPSTVVEQNRSPIENYVNLVSVFLLRDGWRLMHQRTLSAVDGGRSALRRLIARRRCNGSRTRELR
jgi:hypothetical protein